MSLSLSLSVFLSVLCSSQASVTVVQVSGVSSALSVSSSTGETHACSVKVTSHVTDRHNPKKTLMGTRHISFLL